MASTGKLKFKGEDAVVSGGVKKKKKRSKKEPQEQTERAIVVRVRHLLEVHTNARAFWALTVRHISLHASGKQS